LSAAHLHDTFGALGLTDPVDGEVEQPEVPEAAAHLDDARKPELDPQPTEVELAY
jgi:hypothetical protein